MLEHGHDSNLPFGSLFFIPTAMKVNCCHLCFCYDSAHPVDGVGGTIVLSCPSVHVCVRRTFTCVHMCVLGQRQPLDWFAVDF